MVPSNANNTPGGTLHTQSNPELASNFPQTTCISNESMSLKREHLQSSLVITPQQAPATKIQKLPLDQNSHPLLLHCNTLTNTTSATNKCNDLSQVKIQPIGRLCSSTTSNNNAQGVDNTENQKICSVIARPQSKVQVTNSQTPAFETNNASPVFNKINQLNDALTAINPR